MKKEIKKKIERAFYNYEDNKKLAVNEILEDIASRMTTTSFDKLSVKASPGNNVENTILNYIQLTSNNYNWCKVVEDTLTKYAFDYKDKLIVYKYFKKWGTIRCIRELNICEMTFYRWKDEILTTAFMFAREKGLIK